MGPRGGCPPEVGHAHAPPLGGVGGAPAGGPNAAGAPAVAACAADAQRIDAVRIGARCRQDSGVGDRDLASIAAVPSRAAARIEGAETRAAVAAAATDALGGDRD